MDKKKLVSIVIFVSLLVIPIAALFKFHGNLTPLIHISDEIVESGKSFWKEPLYYLKEGGYDSQYYYLNMHDLTNTTGEVPVAYRTRVMLPTVVHSIANYFGIETVSYVLYFVNFLCLVLAWVLFKKIYDEYQVPWFSSLFFLNIGILTSFKYGLTEPMALLFLACAFYILQFKRGAWFAVMLFLSLAFCLLSRDAFVFPVLGLGVYFVLKREWLYSGSIALSVVPVILWKRFLSVGKDMNNDLSLFKLDSFLEYAYPLVSQGNAGRVNFLLCLLFLLFLIILLVKVIWPLKKRVIGSPYALASLFSLFFLGLFNPTSAWSNISGIGRHLTCLFPLLPVVMTEAGVLPKWQKWIQTMNLFFVLVFFVWFMKSLSREYFLYSPF